MAPSAKIVSPDEWQAARLELLAQEKALTKARDELAATRRRQPLMRIEPDYVFQGLDGAVPLTSLFEGRQQLIVYHHMLKPADKSPCSGCCMVLDSIANPAHLHARNTTFAVVSKAPVTEAMALSARMNWSFPWYQTTDSFNADMGVTTGFGLSVFLTDDSGIYRSYFTSGRGVETLGSPWSLLDLTPLGRQEVWEESPDDVLQTAPYQWWRLHDEYD